jgi:hypothetical protein
MTHLKVNLKSIIFILIVISIGCRSNNNYRTKDSVYIGQPNCKQSIIIDTFQQNLMTLTYIEFDTSEIKKIFNKPYRFNLTTTFPNSTSFICNFKSDSSEIFISTKGQKLDYFLDFARIRDNSIQLNYDIKIGMTKKKFFNSIKHQLIPCDSIEINEIGSMSLFIFKESVLKEILLTTTI